MEWLSMLERFLASPSQSGNNITLGHLTSVNPLYFLIKWDVTFFHSEQTLVLLLGDGAG